MCGEWSIVARTGWSESVTLQLGSIHPMLSSYGINNIKSYVGLLYLELKSRSLSVTTIC